MRKSLLGLLLTVALVIIMACQPQDFSDRESLMEAKVKERVEDYRLGLIRRCREKVMKEASSRVDSILVARSEKIFSIDTISRPERPVKPVKPQVPLLDESEPIAPVVGKNSNGDTLNF